MNFFDTALKRNSYRGKFLPGTVPYASLKRIVEIALAAPSGRNKETTVIVAVTSPDKIKEASEIIEKPQIADAGALLLLAFDPAEEYGVEDCSALCQNALLAITASGYASCWLDGALKRENRIERLAKLVELPQPYKIKILLPVGRAADQVVPPVKKSIKERAFLDKYGASLS
ncbi:MAG: nitroreductase family protein [Fibrobacteres bacterium]|nr:nitroreductase family protein [Fibrobacterota bacterium]